MSFAKDMKELRKQKLEKVSEQKKKREPTQLGQPAQLGRPSSPSPLLFFLLLSIFFLGLISFPGPTN
jgi:hypothetical protein